MESKKAFGTLFSGTQFLALVQVKSTHSHERYRLRWYTVSETGGCIPGALEDFGIAALDRIGSRLSKMLLYTLTKGFYTVGRPSWRSIDPEFLRLCQTLGIKSDDRSTYVDHVMRSHDLRLYAIEHDRRNDPFRKIWPSF